MSRGKHLFACAGCALLVATTLSAKSPCGERSEAKAEEPRPAPELTHLQMDVFEVRGPAEMLMQIEPVVFEDHTEADRTILEVAGMLERLDEFGQARLTARVNTRANIRQQNRIQERHTIPLRSVTGNRSRRYTTNAEWSVMYEGAWGGKNGLQAEIDYRIEHKGVWPQKTGEEGDSQPREYSWYMTQSVVQGSGVPVVLVKYRQDAADGAEAMVTVVRLQATRLDDAGQPMAMSRMEDCVRVPVFTEREIQRILDVAEGQTGWVIGETKSKDDKAARLIVGVTPRLHQPETPRDARDRSRRSRRLERITDPVAGLGVGEQDGRVDRVAAEARAEDG